MFLSSIWFPATTVAKSTAPYARYNWRLSLQQLNFMFLRSSACQRNVDVQVIIVFAVFQEHPTTECFQMRHWCRKWFFSLYSSYYFAEKSLSAPGV